MAHNFDINTLIDTLKSQITGKRNDAQIADALGVSRATISLWKSGEREPSGAAFSLLALLHDQPSLINDLVRMDQEEEERWEKVDAHLDRHFSEWGAGAPIPVEVGFLDWCWDMREEVLEQLEREEFTSLAREIQQLVDGWYTVAIPGSLDTEEVYMEVSVKDVEKWLEENQRRLVNRLQQEVE